MAADWSAEAGLVSDYRYRGLSMSNGKPALQASIGLEHESGAYAELWGSTLRNGSHGEFDTTLGYAFELSETVSADFSATLYAYPGDTGSNAIEFTGSLEAVHGPVTANLGLSVAPPQRGTRDDNETKRGNFYAFAGASYRLPRVPVTLRTTFGYERGPWDMSPDGGKWDWSAGAEADAEPMRIALDLVGSSAGDEALVGKLALGF
jgi:uncharacterized protein (TIGR02001 family)